MRFRSGGSRWGLFLAVWLAAVVALPGLLPAGAGPVAADLIAGAARASATTRHFTFRVPELDYLGLDLRYMMTHEVSHVFAYAELAARGPLDEVGRTTHCVFLPARGMPPRPQAYALRTMRYAIRNTQL